MINPAFYALQSLNIRFITIQLRRNEARRLQKTLTLLTTHLDFKLYRITVEETYILIVNTYVRCLCHALSGNVKNAVRNL